MRSMRMDKSVALFAWLVLFLPAIIPATAEAQSINQRFLDALREERLFDVAVDYLNDMKSDSKAPPEFVARIPLNQVQVLLDEANLIRDNTRLLQQLDNSESILDDFIKTSPTSALQAEAQEQRARIFMARSGLLLEQAKSDRVTASQKMEYEEEARQYLGKAAIAYEEIRNQMKVTLSKKLDLQDPNAKVERKAMQNRYVDIRLQIPKIKEFIADSYGPDHEQYRTLLNEAATENEVLYKKYSTQLSGINGLIGLARCHHKLGESEKALGYLYDVFNLPRGQKQTIKKREAALIAIDAWETMNPYPVQEAFQYLQKVVYSFSPQYARTPEGVKIQMAFAKACKMVANKITEDGGPNNPDDRARFNAAEKEATRIMRIMARLPGDHREDARQLLADWGKNIANTDAIDDPEKGPPETLVDARTRGKEIQLVVSELKNQSTALTRQWKAADEATKPGLQTKIQELNARIESDTDKALGYFEMALAMSNKDTAADDLSNLRYLQCASYFQKDYFFESAIIGEYMLDQFPNNAGTRSAAGLVCKAYWNLYREAGKIKDQDRTFELEKLKQHSNHIFATWPDSPQAEQAGLIRCLLALSENDTKEANIQLARIPADSPTRAAVVLEVGNRMWFAYVNAKRKGGMTQEELIAARDQATRLLDDGVSALNSSRLRTYDIRSALSLTEALLESDQVDRAIFQLEEAEVAPLDLVKKKNPAAMDETLRRDTYRTAIRAYLAKLRSGEEALGWVEKSQGVLNALRTEIGGTDEGQKQISSFCILLASELKEQFESLETNEQRSTFAEGLESFLTSIGSDAEDRNLLLLTGSMLTEIGQGLKDNGLENQGGRFFAQAVGVYEKLAADANKDDAKTRIAIMRGRANALRGNGKYQESVAQFVTLLMEGDNWKFTELQVDAANACADWGMATEDQDTLVMAIQGGEQKTNSKGKKINAIIGWGALAKRAQRDKKFALMAEGVYNIARCKFKYGQLTTNSDLQKSAIDEIENFSKNVTDMGGPVWQARLNTLLATMKRDKR